MFGILNFHKPKGPTSRDCVNQVQRLVRPVKVGHGGTLDPIASGVLLILVGQASRLTEEVHELDKEYVGTFRLGASSPSVDVETEVTELANAPIPSLGQIMETSKTFLGTIKQTPPIYSALHIGGKRAHELARSGVDVEMPERSVRIDRLEIMDYNYPELCVRIVCGTGTYIRSLGRDLARQLGTDAVMTDLIRTRIGPYRLEDSTYPEQLETSNDVGLHILPAASFVSQWLKLEPSDEILNRLKNGQRLVLEDLDQHAINRAAVIDRTGVLHSIIVQDTETKTWKVLKYFPSLGS